MPLIDYEGNLLLVYTWGFLKMFLGEF